MDPAAASNILGTFAPPSIACSGAGRPSPWPRQDRSGFSPRITSHIRQLAICVHAGGAPAPAGPALGGEFSAKRCSKSSILAAGR